MCIGSSGDCRVAAAARNEAPVVLLLFMMVLRCMLPPHSDAASIKPAAPVSHARTTHLLQEQEHMHISPSAARARANTSAATAHAHITLCSPNQTQACLRCQVVQLWWRQLAGGWCFGARGCLGHVGSLGLPGHGLQHCRRLTRLLLFLILGHNRVSLLNLYTRAASITGKAQVVSNRQHCQHAALPTCVATCSIFLYSRLS